MKKKFHFASFATEFADSAASAAAAVAVGNKRTRVSMEEDADSGIGKHFYLIKICCSFENLFTELRAKT